ncbi:MAG: tRNA pseudouridine(38-40) synthase TruA [Coriobacteriia bacterium]|nr:tRNA pseudouridine(38-40) synthase TruA [Coriobacteriia bacterium]
METYSATVAYKGVAFCGFARQPGLCTVQGELEHALELLFRRPVDTVCAGRTDAGVHARGQVVSFEVGEDELRERSLDSLCKSLNALTHDDISVLELALRPAGFSARFSATMREYRYFISTQGTPPLFMRDFCWHVPRPLDAAAMQEAANLLVGEHDFKSFCLAVSAEGKRTFRYVDQVIVEPVEVLGEQLLCVRVVGNAFLHSMVRTMVGTLVAVGRGLRDAAWVGEVLAACDRQAAGETAPAYGLVFWEVTY